MNHKQYLNCVLGFLSHVFVEKPKVVYILLHKVNSKVLHEERSANFIKERRLKKICNILKIDQMVYVF